MKDATRNRMRAVIINDVEYESITEASIQTGIICQTIIYRCNSKNFDK